MLPIISSVVEYTTTFSSSSSKKNLVAVLFSIIRILLLLLLIHYNQAVFASVASAEDTSTSTRINRRHCFTVYEWSPSSILLSSGNNNIISNIDGHDFAGVSYYYHSTSSESSSHEEVAIFDTPLYYYDEDPIVSGENSTSKVIGRLMGHYWPHHNRDKSTLQDDEPPMMIKNSGYWNFHFFGPNEDLEIVETSSWISASLGFATSGHNNNNNSSSHSHSTSNTPNVIVGGTGHFSSYVGTVQRDEIISTNDDAEIVQYTFCPPTSLDFDVEPPEEPNNDDDTNNNNNCHSIWTWDASDSSIIVVGNYSFTGDTNYEGQVGILDNPIFDSVNATSERNPENLIGRNLGTFFTFTELETNVANFNFQFFHNDDNIEDGSSNEDWIVTSFGFSFTTGLGEFTTNEQPNVILGGSGKYSGIVGTIEDTVVAFLPTTPEGESTAEINNYIICDERNNDPFPSLNVINQCTEIYELSITTTTDESLTIGNYSFSGVSYLDNDNNNDNNNNVSIGLFDTPFYLNLPDDIIIQEDNSEQQVPPTPNPTPDGRIMGTFYVNSRGAATGQWNFHFFGGNGNNDTTSSSISGWVSGNLGFSNNNNDDGSNPDVITGGTGDWIGFVGKAKAVEVVNSDPLVYKWIICPEGFDYPPSTSTTTEAPSSSSSSSSASSNNTTSEGPSSATEMPDDGTDAPPTETPTSSSGGLNFGVFPTTTTSSIGRGVGFAPLLLCVAQYFLLH